jgi:hypothetical protein
MEIAAEVWFWVGPKATGTARFGREPRRHGACIKGSYPTNPSGTCRSADGPVAVIALANRKGDAVRRSVLASGASEVGTADCIRHVYPAWCSSLQTPTSGSQTSRSLGIATGSAGGRGGIRTHEGLAPLAVFKTAALNHSATLPDGPEMGEGPQESNRTHQDCHMIASGSAPEDRTLAPAPALG